MDKLLKNALTDTAEELGYEIIKYFAHEAYFVATFPQSDEMVLNKEGVVQDGMKFSETLLENFLVNVAVLNNHAQHNLSERDLNKLNTQLTEKFEDQIAGTAEHLEKITSVLISKNSNSIDDIIESSSREYASKLAKKFAKQLDGIYKAAKLVSGSDITLTEDGFEAAQRRVNELDAILEEAGSVKAYERKMVDDTLAFKPKIESPKSVGDPLSVSDTGYSSGEASPAGLDSPIFSDAVKALRANAKMSGVSSVPPRATRKTSKSR